VHPVSLNGPTEGRAELPVTEVSLTYRVTRPRLVPVEPEECAAELIGAAFGHCIDQRTGEVALPHVVGGQEDLVLLDGIESHRAAVSLAARLPGTTQPKPIVDRSPVHLNRVEPVVLPRRRDTALTFTNLYLGRELHEISKVAVQRWQPSKQRVIDGGLGPLTVGGEVRAGCIGQDDQLFDLNCLAGQDGVGPHRLRQRNADALTNDWAVTDCSNGHPVGAAGRKPQHRVVTSLVYRNGPAQPGLDLKNFHDCVRYGRPAAVDDLS
jgi:hypothetical protein